MWDPPLYYLELKEERSPWGQVGELAFDPQPGVEGGHRRVFEGAQHDYTCEEAAARCCTNVECSAELELGDGKE